MDYNRLSGLEIKYEGKESANLLSAIYTLKQIQRTQRLHDEFGTIGSVGKMIRKANKSIYENRLNIHLN